MLLLIGPVKYFGQRSPGSTKDASSHIESELVDLNHQTINPKCVSRQIFYHQQWLFSKYKDTQITTCKSGK